MKTKIFFKNSKLAAVLLLALWLVSCTTAPTALAPAPTATVSAPTVADTSTPTVPPPTAVPVEPTVQPSPTEAPPQPTAKPTSGSTRISEKDKMVEIFIDAGEFIMGSNENDAKVSTQGNRAFPEIPQHKVTLPSYWMDKFEVSNAQYAICVKDGACKAPNYTRSYTREKYYGNPEFDNYPVLYVSWYMSREYCAWAGRRLPTEAEWEKAARGTDGRRYPWGNEPITGERANFCDKNCPKEHAFPDIDDGYPDTAPVDAYPTGASPYGVMNMSGNVWEWTITKIRPYPYDPNDGRESSEQTDERVWRGGPWSNGMWWIRSTIRYHSVPTYWYGNLGFRCAASE